MPSQTKSSTSKSVDAGLLERVAEASRKANETYLDIAEKTAGRVADLQERVGRAVPIGQVAKLASAQATVTRGTAEAYVSAARELID